MHFTFYLPCGWEAYETGERYNIYTLVVCALDPILRAQPSALLSRSHGRKMMANRIDNGVWMRWPIYPLTMTNVHSVCRTSTPVTVNTVLISWPANSVVCKRLLSHRPVSSFRWLNRKLFKIDLINPRYRVHVRPGELGCRVHRHMYSWVRNEKRTPQFHGQWY